MAIDKAAICLALAVAVLPAAQFSARHLHWRKGCAGEFTIDASGVAFRGAKNHAWTWTPVEIQQLTVAPDSVRVVTYQDDRRKLGADRVYEFTAKVPVEEIYAALKPAMGPRLVAAFARPIEPAAGLPRDARSIEAKRLGLTTGTQGRLVFGEDSLAWITTARDDSRLWTYTEITSVASAGPYDLTIETGAYKQTSLHFQLKQPLSEASYDQLWLRVERKNGRIP